MAAHLYWRVNVLSTGNHVGISVTDFSMASVAGGPNLLTGGVASASSQYNADYGAAFACDGNAGTRWATTNDSDIGWWQYEFAAPVEIAEVKIMNSPDGGNDPAVWMLQYSDDGVTFTDSGRGTITSQPWTAGMTQTFDVTPLPPPHWETRRYWRVDVLRSIDGNHVYINELTMAASVGGANLLTGGTASDVSGSAANAAAACDGNPDSQWGVGGGSGWWQYDFVRLVGIAEITMMVESPWPETGPHQWQLQYSDDGVTFTTQKQFLADPWASGVPQTFEVGVTEPSSITTRRRPVVILQ